MHALRLLLGFLLREFEPNNKFWGYITERFYLIQTHI